MLDDPNGMLDDIRDHIRGHLHGGDVPDADAWYYLAEMFTALDMHLVETASGARGDYMPDAWVEDHIT